MLVFLTFALLMIALRAACLAIQPGWMKTLAIVVAATILVPAALLTIRIGIAYADPGALTPNEHVASAFVSAVLAMFVTPVFALVFRRRARPVTG